MDHVVLLKELAIIMGLGVLVTVLLSKLRLPTVAGLLAAGALLGPYGFQAVEDSTRLRTLAQVGVVLLLFTIGLEFSLGRLRHIFKQVALGGLVQVVSTIAATAGIVLLAGQSVGRAIFWGFVFAMSSTAIVLRALSDRGELDAPHGRFIVGALIFQDLCVIPMVLLLPALGSGNSPGAIATDIFVALFYAASIVTGVLVGARLLVPRLLKWVDASRSREVFLLAVLAICIGTTWLTSLAGLSVALGAFLGGMVVADTEFQHRALGDMIPLRDAFVSVFFISLGMLFDGRLIFSHPLEIGLLLVGFVAGKALLSTLSAVLMHFPARAASLAGVGLGQFGEFGFVLITAGEPLGLIEPQTASLLLSAGILSMFLTPILIRMAPHISAGERLLAPLTRLLGVRSVDQVEPLEKKEKHVVVIGYGIAGKLVVQSLQACGIRHVVLELNVETVRRARQSGEEVYYADATSVEALRHANVGGAHAVVVLINDPSAMLRVVDSVHRVAPQVPILIRARYFLERQRLMTLGATEVVVEEVEASVEVLGRLLRRLEIPRNVIVSQIRTARQEMQTSDRKITLPRNLLPELAALADLKIESFLVNAGTHAVGRTSRELDIQNRTRALIVAVRRGEHLWTHPDPSEPFAVGDIVYLVGSGEAVRSAMDLLEGGCPQVPLGQTP